MMLLILFIILSVVFAIMALTVFISNTYSNAYVAVTLTVGVIALFTAAIFITVEMQNHVTTDVHQNEASLKITNNSGVTIDSTVVFKKR